MAALVKAEDDRNSKDSFGLDIEHFLCFLLCGGNCAVLTAIEKQKMCM